MSEPASIPVPSHILAESVWISFNPDGRAALGFGQDGRSLSFTADFERGFSIFVAEEGWPETFTKDGHIGEAVPVPVPVTPRTGVVKIVGDGPPRYHVVEIRGGWTAWIRP